MLFKAWIVLSPGGGVSPGIMSDYCATLSRFFVPQLASSCIVLDNATTPECGILNDFFNLRVGLYPNH